MFLEAYFLGELDINEIVTSISDDIAAQYQIGDGSDITELSVDVQQLMRPAALLKYVRMHNAVRKNMIPLFVKTHAPHMITNGIELLPECLTKAVIYIVRDPRDVLPSYAKHMGVDLDSGLESMQDKYRCLKATKGRVGEIVSDWDGHVNSYLNADTHNVKYFLYEDMLKDPVGQFAKMLEHAGIEPDMERVEKAVELCNLENLKKKEKKEGFKESSPHAKDHFFGKGGSANRHKLSPKNLHTIEKKFGRIMKRLGYLKQKVA